MQEPGRGHLILYWLKWAVEEKQPGTEGPVKAQSGFTGAKVDRRFSRLK